MKTIKKLSVREIQVLNLLKQGKKNKDIAKFILTKDGNPLSEKTISTYILRIKGKLGVSRYSNIFEVITKAAQLGCFQTAVNSKGNKSYRIDWYIELNAPNELEAALLALDIQRDTNSEALTFTVTEIGTMMPTEVDLRE